MRTAAAIVVTVLALATAGPAPAEAATAAAPPNGLAAVSFTGESGMSGISSSKNASVSAAAARSGRGGLALASTNAASFAQWTGIPQGHAYAALRLWVRVQRRGSGQSVDLVTVGNARSTANFDLFVNGNNQRLQWDLYRANTDATSFALAYGRWYLVEARVEFSGSEHTAQVRIDGVDQGTIRSAGKSTTVRLLNVGTMLVKTHTQHYDDVVLRVGDAPLTWLPAPT